MTRGRFLTLEGVDGAGKSTHLDWLCETLRSQGITVVQTREPGGTPLGEHLRSLLLHTPMQLETETLLVFAARCEHVRTVIEPALARGEWVVCDRFTDASYAYQGGGRQLGADLIRVLENWVHPHLQPDRTWLFDLAPEIARERLERTRPADRFEREDNRFFERTRAAYLERARQDASRFLVIDAAQPIDVTRDQLRVDLERLIHAR